MKRIERRAYQDRLQRLRGTPDIKIITGIRRSGKSELLRAMRELWEQEDQVHIIAIDFTNLLFDDLKTYKALFAYVEDHYQPGQDNILMIDEVQLCDQFELAVNSFHNSGKYDIYITGSNAFLLSSDLATLFTGRYIEIPVYPFSFAEYCQYFDVGGGNDRRESPIGDDQRKFPTGHDPARALQDYFLTGGMAGAYVYADEEDRRRYIQGLYQTIIFRDLVDKYGIQDTALMNTLADYLMDNIANLTSAHRISTALQQDRRAVNHVTIGSYLEALCRAFLFYKVKRYDIKGKRYLATSDKYYLADLSFRYAQLGRRNMDYGRAYENLVAIELLRRGYAVYVGKLYDKEIDFVAMRGGEKTYIQVADSIEDPATLKRELAPLRAIQDAYPKLLLANTHHPASDWEGIRVIDLATWLLQA